MVCVPKERINESAAGEAEDVGEGEPRFLRIVAGEKKKIEPPMSLSMASVRKRVGSGDGDGDGMMLGLDEHQPEKFGSWEERLIRSK